LDDAEEPDRQARKAQRGAHWRSKELQNHREMDVFVVARHQVR
jgi:hypothetical protein